MLAWEAEWPGEPQVIRRCGPLTDDGANRPFNIDRNGNRICFSDGQLNLNAGPVLIEGKESPDDAVAGILDIELVVGNQESQDYRLVVIAGALECERLELIFTDARRNRHYLELHEDSPMLHSISFSQPPSIRHIEVRCY